MTSLALRNSFNVTISIKILSIIYLCLEYTKKSMDNFFEYQGMMSLNIEKVLEKISEEQPNENNA